MKRKLLIVELNEFNVELLANNADKFGLKNIRRLLKMNRSLTSCDELKEHHGLDPWVQWVSIHTGVGFNTHKIKHLSQENDSGYPQIWEILSKDGFTSGIWGALNSSLGNTSKCLFFFPDPWSFSQNAYPIILNNFLALPRYFSKNYLSLLSQNFFISIFRFIFYFFTTDTLFLLRKDFLYIINSLLKQPLSTNLLFSLYDLVSCRIFLKYQKEFNPDFLIIFLNSLAHSQHKYWGKTQISKELEFTLKNVDRILGNLFDSISSEYALIIMNGLSQKNVDGSGYCIYRQINPRNFIKFLGLNFIKIEQCMTNDCFVFFKNRNELLNAYDVLSDIKVNNKKIFDIEIKYDNEIKLFYQFNFFNRLDKETFFYVGNNKYKFFDHFSLLAERTGSHVPKGDIFSHGINLNPILTNYQITKFILKFFRKS